MSELREVFPDAALLQEFLYLVAGYQMFATCRRRRVTCMKL